MKLLGREILHQLTAKHPDTRGWVRSWTSEVEDATWRSPNDIKRRYASASFLSDNRVVFNVRGNDFRLEARIAYGVGVVQVIWAGTHAEYTKRKL